MGVFCIYPDEYRPRQPKKSSLFRLLDGYYKEFRNVYDDRFSKRYGFWRPVTDEVAVKFQVRICQQRCLTAGISGRMVAFRKKSEVYRVEWAAL